jgi:hypothetical protein
MATQLQSSWSERPRFEVVRGERRSKQRKPTSTRARLISTFIALVVLGVVLRFLPAGATRNPQAKAHSERPVAKAGPADLEISSLQVSEAVGGETLYLDGRVNNASTARITEAKAEVTFRDLQGQLVASLLLPLSGMPKGGVGAVRGEFAQNPIGPEETRFFRVAVEQVPPAWNHEVPELKIVAVKAK